MAIKYIRAYSLYNVSDTIKQMRSDAGMTQRELAKSTGIVESTYSRYEKGTRRVPFEVFQKIAESTGHQIQII